jgi:hypothetical protein
MPDSEKTAMLLEDLAALDPAQRREVVKELRNVSDTFAEVPDGRDHRLRSRAHASLPRGPKWRYPRPSIG